MVFVLFWLAVSISLAIGSKPLPIGAISDRSLKTWVERHRDDQ